MNEEKKEPQIENGTIQNKENTNPNQGLEITNREISSGAEIENQTPKIEMQNENIQPEIKNENFTPVEEVLASEPFQEDTAVLTPVLDSLKPKEEKKDKNKMPILIGVIFALLLIIAVFYFIWNNSKNLFLGAINKEYTELMGNIQLETPYEDAKKSSIVTEGNISLDVENINNNLIDNQTKSLLEEISKLDMNYTYGIDYKNKKFAFQTNITYDKNDMVKVNLYGQEKNIYLELTDLFSKYINIPYEELDTLFEDPNSTIEEEKTIIKSIKNAFLNALESKDFKKTKETIKIENKEKKVKKISYTINKENITKIKTSIIEDLQKDKSFLSILSKKIGKSEKEIKDNLEKQKNAFQNENNAVHMIFSIYFEGITNKAVQYEITDEQINTCMYYQKGNKEKKFAIVDNEKEMLTVVNAKKEEGNTKTTIVIPSLDLEGIIEKKKDTYDITFQDSKDTFKITGKYTQKKKEEENTNTINTTLAFQMETQNQVIANIKAVTNSKNTIGKSVSQKQDLVNSVKIEDMTQIEKSEILIGMMQNKTLMQFIDTVESLTYTTKSNAYNE